MDDLRVVIADDEPLARERLRELLRAEPGIDVVGECADGPETVRTIEEESPDVVFLDVRMPKLDGFGVIGALKPGSIPAIVIVTAYGEFAVRAFEEGSVDYLLKPFDRDRLRKALSRARDRVARGEHLQQIRQLLERFEAPFANERICIKSEGRVLFLKTREIDWIRGADNYAELHVGKSVHLLRQTLSSLEQTLRPDHFVRISRSLIVNVERVKEYKIKPYGDYLVILRDGTELCASRTCRGNLKRLLSGGSE
jgi:two-component system LytT family response regulator